MIGRVFGNHRLHIWSFAVGRKNPAIQLNGGVHHVQLGACDMRERNHVSNRCPLKRCHRPACGTGRNAAIQGCAPHQVCDNKSLGYPADTSETPASSDPSAICLSSLKSADGGPQETKRPSNISSTVVVTRTLSSLSRTSNRRPSSDCMENSTTVPCAPPYSICTSPPLLRAK